LDAVDTNILVYAAVAAVPQHKKARDTLRALAEGPGAWALPWPCCYEFLRIVTHPRVYKPPMSVSAALGFLRPLLASPSLRVLHESERHFAVLERLLAQSGVSGNLIHDAHIAALCEEHGVGRLITADRDFARFPGLVTWNPF
jgi:toxin-antitoxin system PIN domain toxin